MRARYPLGHQVTLSLTPASLHTANGQTTLPRHQFLILDKKVVVYDQLLLNLTVIRGEIGR